MMIEQVKFQLGQKVHFVLNPMQKGMVVSIILYADGGCKYEVNYLNSEGELRIGAFFACELEIDED